MILQRFVRALSVLPFLAACGGGLGTSAPVQAALTPAVHYLRLAPRAASSASLYIYDSRLPPTAIDQIPASGGNPTRVLRTGIALPGLVAIDGQGTLYVENAPTNLYDVTAYPTSATSPSVTITTGIGLPTGMAIGPNNELYVMDGGGQIVEYASQSATPLRYTILPNCGLSAPPGLAVDAVGDAYVLAICGRKAKIYEFGSSLTLMRELTVPPLLPVGLAVDTHGTVFLSLLDPSNFKSGLAEYEPGATKPSLTFEFGAHPPNSNGAGYPIVDAAAGRVFVAEGACQSINNKPWHCEGGVYGFVPGDSKPVVVLTPPKGTLLGDPLFDSSGNIYLERALPTSDVVSIVQYSPQGALGAPILQAPDVALAGIWSGTPSSARIAWQRGEPALTYHACGGAARSRAVDVVRRGGCSIASP